MPAKAETLDYVFIGNITRTLVAAVEPHSAAWRPSVVPYIGGRLVCQGVLCS